MINIQKNVELAKYTTFGIGGQSKYFVMVKDISQLKEALLWAGQIKLKWYILGGGSNILIQDEKLEALVIKIDNQNIEIKNNSFAVDAGVKLSVLVDKTYQLGLSGLEFFIGIPGTVGGAVYKNTHWKNHYVSDNVQGIQTVDQYGKVRQIKKEELKFSYNFSSLQDKKLVISKLYFKFAKKTKKDLFLVMDKIKKHRARNQPKGRSVGCIFKNPGDLSAGKLIVQAGLGGKKEGDIQVNNLHANFFINTTGQGKAKDVIRLTEIVRKKVKAQSGHDLQPEIFLWSNKK